MRVLLLFVLGYLAVATGTAAVVEKPAALTADGIPAVPAELAERTRPYMEFRTAAFLGWHPRDRSMLIATRFANTNQVHRVAQPGGARQQLTFEEDRISAASHAPVTGDVTVVQKDVGGNEFFQLYTLANGRLTLLTDGKSRNQFGAWSKDGKHIGYSSTRRNGTDTDLYVMDPRDRATDRLVAQVKGGGWNIADFTPDGKRALVIEYASITKSNLWLLDVAAGALQPIGDHAKSIAYGGAQFAPDGALWVTSDEGSDFQRLGTLDVKAGRFTPRTPETKWDVEEFDIAEDGSFIAYAVNDAGRSVLRILDWPAGTSRTIATSGRDARRHRGRALGRDRPDVHVREEPGGCILGRAENARADALDDERDRGARSQCQCRARAIAGQELRWRGGVRLPLPARREAVSRAATADRQHPWRSGRPEPARLPRSQ